jgi:trimeric autotransporter adhesin
MKRFSLKYKLLVTTVFVLFVWAIAADIPFTFKPGDLISADQMNQNFAALNKGKQELVKGTCAAGSSVRSIAPDGSVTCEVDDIGNGSNSGVDAVNGMTGAVTLQAGDNITLDDSQQGQIRISATAGGTNSNTHDHFGQEWTGANDKAGLSVTNTSGLGVALVGRKGAGSGSPDIEGSAAIWGDAQSGAGVFGSSLTGSGLFGVSTAGVGVYGDGKELVGVFGRSTGGAGVSGQSDAGSGVEASSQSGFAGLAVSQSGAGIAGSANTDGDGVRGFSSSGNGVHGCSDNGVGVRGFGKTFGGIFEGIESGVYVNARTEANPDLYLAGGSGIISGSELLLKADGGVTLRLDQNNDSTSTFNLRNGADTLVFSVAESGDANMAGTITQGSDRNIKHDLRNINSRDVLEKVVTMPIRSWRYNADPASNHIGPMAQDFYAAFGLGSTDKGIATVDAEGISLAAIQGLYHLVQEQSHLLQAQEKRLAALETQRASR